MLGILLAAYKSDNPHFVLLYYSLAVFDRRANYLSNPITLLADAPGVYEQIFEQLSYLKLLPYGRHLRFNAKTHIVPIFFGRAQSKKGNKILAPWRLCVKSSCLNVIK